MSLHFNWSRLDETCAEALRQLINKRLAEVVERINKKSGTTDTSSPSSSPPATQHFSTATQGNHVLTGTTTAVSSPLVEFSGGSGGNPVRAEPSSNVSAYGSPRLDVYGSMLGASDLPSRSPFLSAYPPNSTAGWGTSAQSNAAATSSAGGPGPAFTGANAQHTISGGYLPPAARPADGLTGVSGAANEEGNGYAGRFSGATGGAPGRGGLLNATSTNPATATGANDTFAAGGGADGGPFRGGTLPSGGNPPSYVPSPGVVREGETGTLTSAPRKVPPIVYLEVGSVEWGTTPPFVEVVAFDNATDGPPGYRHPPQRGGNGLNSTTAGTSLGDVRDGSAYGLSHVASTDTAATSSAALAGCFPASTTMHPGSGGDNGPDNGSETSHDFTVAHSGTGVSTPHMATSAHLTGMASMMASSTAVGGGAPPQTQAASTSLPQVSNQPETTDALASVLGYGGLHIRFHITYGGALHLSLNTAVQHEVRLGAVALRVSLPMMFYLANLDLDCYLCINVKNNACQVWLEHGPLSTSVVNRLSITATFGGDNDVDGDGVDYGASSTDFYSRFGSSSVSDDDGGEGGNGVYVNEHEVSQFVLHELRAILKETIVAPHCITIPISFGG